MDYPQFVQLLTTSLSIVDPDEKYKNIESVRNIIFNDIIVYCTWNIYKTREKILHLKTINIDWIFQSSQLLLKDSFNCLLKTQFFCKLDLFQSQHEA